jgi:hypothetical protein
MADFGNSPCTSNVLIERSTDMQHFAAQSFTIRAPISCSELALRVLVGPPVGAWHLQPVPANRICDRLPFLDGFLRFEVTRSCLNSRPAANGNERHRQQVRQLASRHFDNVTRLDTMPWPGPFAAHFNVPALHCRCRQDPRLEESRVPQPLVYAL